MSVSSDLNPAVLLYDTRNAFPDREWEPAVEVPDFMARLVKPDSTAIGVKSGPITIFQVSNGGCYGFVHGKFEACWTGLIGAAGRDGNSSKEFVRGVVRSLVKVAKRPAPEALPLEEATRG